jgi:hypothetical protein
MSSTTKLNAAIEDTIGSDGAGGGGHGGLASKQGEDSDGYLSFFHPLAAHSFERHPPQHPGPPFPSSRPMAGAHVPRFPPTSMQVFLYRQRRQSDFKIFLYYRR